MYLTRSIIVASEEVAKKRDKRIDGFDVEEGGKAEAD
jgi:hypothetical protein